MQKRWSFPFWTFSVNVTKSPVLCELVWICWHLLKKFLLQNFIFSLVTLYILTNLSSDSWHGWSRNKFRTSFVKKVFETSKQLTFPDYIWFFDISCDKKKLLSYVFLTFLSPSITVNIITYLSGGFR